MMPYIDVLSSPVELRVSGHCNGRLVIFQDSSGPFGGFPSSELSRLIQTHSCVALDKATYSASAVERATVSCFLLRHDTGPPAIWNR